MNSKFTKNPPKLKMSNNLMSCFKMISTFMKEGPYLNYEQQKTHFTW